MKAQVSTWGDGLAVPVPKAAAEALNLKAGQTLDVAVEGGALRLTPGGKPRPRYTHDELVAQMKPENQPEFEDWGPAVGDELPL
jgi:antitoxin component of MazEF toxin-antitoxin module